MPLQIVKSDITKMHVDAIVNAANYNPVVGSNVDRAVYTAAGYEELLVLRQKLGIIKPGEVGVTPGLRLQTKYILHAVGLPWLDGEHGEMSILESCYRNALEKAYNLQCKSMAIPFLATGNFGYPKRLALDIALTSIRTFLNALVEDDFMVYLVVYDDESVKLTQSLFAGLESYLAQYLPKTAHPSSNESNFLKAKYSSCANYTKHSRETIDEQIYEPIELAEDRACASEKASELPIHADASSSLQYSVKAVRLNKKDSLEDILKQKRLTFSQTLLKMLDERGMEETDFYKRANLDRKRFSKMRNKDYKPNKNTVLAVIIALHLDVETAQELMALAGFAWNVTDTTDLIVMYCLNKKIYDIDRINYILYEKNEKCLGISA